MNEIILDLPRPDRVDNARMYIDEWKKIRDELEHSIESISDDVFKRPMEDKSWSAAEITEHVSLTQCRFARVIPMILKGRLGIKTPSDKPADYDEVEKYYREHRKIKNPESVTPVKIQDKANALKSLRDAMKLFEKNITSAGIDELKGRSFEHFIFGPVNLIEFTWILIQHENHHTWILRKKYKLT